MRNCKLLVRTPTIRNRSSRITRRNMKDTSSFSLNEMSEKLKDLCYTWTSYSTTFLFGIQYCTSHVDVVVDVLRASYVGFSGTCRNLERRRFFPPFQRAVVHLTELMLHESSLRNRWLWEDDELTSADSGL